MCKPYLFQTQCVCKSCGRRTEPSHLVVFADGRCDQLPPGTTQAEHCPFLEPPVVITAYRDVYPSPRCRRTVARQLQNATGDLLASLAVVGDLVASDARLRFDEVDGARAHQRLSLRKLKAALDGGDLHAAKRFLEDVSGDAVIVRDSSERWEMVRERISDRLKDMVIRAAEARSKASALS